ncbi:hypothetical protein [Amycolatopsis sp. NBC_01480]|uniref:hypothetical protein n=1 Tax=Amycolatopsis sp. NBC_01480 TaxID=2903562 RepID=UPI002E2DEF3A|nr:hypothetical protein [Amycolatopsis sp. NBC_01480]
MSTPRPETRRLLTTSLGLSSIAVGALVAGTLTHAFLFTEQSPQAQAATTASSASGITVNDGEHFGPAPSVSSSGEIRTGGGSVSSPSGAVVASGISLRAGAGLAEATVASVRVGGTSVGPFSAKCHNGVTTVSAAAHSSGNLTVTPGASGGASGTAATITVTTPGAKKAITVRVAAVACGTGTPPTSPPTSNPTPPGRPTSPAHRPNPTERPGHPSDRDQQHTDTGQRPAPTATPKPGHLPVTG